MKEGERAAVTILAHMLLQSILWGGINANIVGYLRSFLFNGVGAARMIVGLIGPYPCPVNNTLELSIQGKILVVVECGFDNASKVLTDSISEEPLPEMNIECNVSSSRDSPSKPSEFSDFLLR
jgi:hypothetical protein